MAALEENTPMDVDEDDDNWGNEGDGDEGWDEGDFGDAEDGNFPTHTQPPETITQARPPVVQLTPAQIDEAIQQQVESIKDELEIPDEHCLLLLRKFKWNIGKIRDNYFSGNPDEILDSAGVCTNPQSIQHTSGVLECGVCMDDLPASDFYALECGHQSSCRNCWVDYLTDAIQTKECVNLPCPSYQCNVVIPVAVFRELLSDVNPRALARFERFRRENFVEFNKDFGFCPGPNCEMIYSAPAGIALTVSCSQCTFAFCWKCKQEKHHPSACHTATEWNIKCSSEAENIQWILAKTKRCPKCGVHIEKNQGCNHMTCRKSAGGCGFEFCWLCKGDWKAHGSATGGYYQCNVYETNKKDGRISNEEKAAEDAQNELQRYEFHWTRFDSHIKSSLHATKQKSETQNRMHELSAKFGWRLNESQFLLNAVEEAMHCWHVLAWTYPIAYYFDDAMGNLELFKTQQQNLEKFCDGLQEKLDFSLEQLGDNHVRQDIVNYTRTAQQYRRNLVDHIENDLSF